MDVDGWMPICPPFALFRFGIIGRRLTDTGPNHNPTQKQDILERAFAVLHQIKEEDLVPNDSALRANTCLQYAVRACGLDCVACCV